MSQRHSPNCRYTSIIRKQKRKRSEVFQNSNKRCKVFNKGAKEGEIKVGDATM